MVSISKKSCALPFLASPFWSKVCYTHFFTLIPHTKRITLMENPLNRRPCKAQDSEEANWQEDQEIGHCEFGISSACLQMSCWSHVPEKNSLATCATPCIIPSMQTKPNALRPITYALRKSRGEAPTIAGFPPFIFFLAEPPPIGARSLPLS